ncbi:MAG: hypothetical protein HQ511_06910 [Rhodospirillales bacterium]|nr:hypothetical protein [Rhodospirillales bacterium]
MHELLEVYAGKDGETHFRRSEMEFELRDFAPPSQPLMISNEISMTTGVFSSRRRDGTMHFMRHHASNSPSRFLAPLQSLLPTGKLSRCRRVTSCFSTMRAARAT